MKAMQETWVQCLGPKDPPEKGKATYSSFVSGGFHGKKNIAGYSPWCRLHMDTPEGHNI